MPKRRSLTDPQAENGWVQTKFVCTVNPQAKSVYLAGDFNGWDPEADRMTRRGGGFVRVVRLPRGEHQYKFIVDGQWTHDPAAARQAPNECGSLNSVITV